MIFFEARENDEACVVDHDVQPAETIKSEPAPDMTRNDLPPQPPGHGTGNGAYPRDRRTGATCRSKTLTTESSHTT